MQHKGTKISYEIVYKKTKTDHILPIPFGRKASDVLLKLYKCYKK